MMRAAQHANIPLMSLTLGQCQKGDVHVLFVAQQANCVWFLAIPLRIEPEGLKINPDFAQVVSECLINPFPWLHLFAAGDEGVKDMVAFRAFPRNFGESEDGNTTIFSVLMLILILTITGASVDIMRFEATRATMQSTLDRAVLAAADLDQAQDPTFVVNDYLTKAGVASSLTNVDVSQGINFRTVTAEGEVDMDTFFLHMSGFDKLTAPGLSVAEEKISNVEISLVLDVSGSMGGSRIENMQDAAKSFVETVISPVQGNAGLTTVSIVPYNAAVSLGTTIAPYWSVSDDHNYSNCPIFSATDFASVPINPNVELDKLAHFDLWSTSETTTSIPYPWCPTGDTSAVKIHNTNVQELKTYIDGLTAGGNTAIDLGVKWGAALLDPDTNPVVTAMVNDGLIVGEAADRPSAYENNEVIKFIVVMTDGENTTEFDLKSKFKSGYSDVWVDELGNGPGSDDRFSLLVDDNYGSNNDVYFRHRFENSSSSNRYASTPDGGSNARRMTNQELFARFGTKGVARKMYVQPYYDGKVSYSEYYDVYYAYTSIVNGATADDRLSAICAAARNEGLVIFAVAFEAPQGGQDALLDCASSPSHYFDVEGVEITETFHAIARQINSLRLIQ